MKKTIVLMATLFIMVSVSCAIAEVYDNLSFNELKQMRDEMIVNLNAVNTALGQKIRSNELTDGPVDGNVVLMTDGTINTSEEGLPLGKIKDLFPDKALAKFVRDTLGKISIEQTVTQDELDTITWLSLSSDKDYGDFSDLTGIGYLRNLSTFGLYASMDYLGAEFPEEFYTLTKLVDLSISDQKITSLSESIGNLTKLEYLSVRNTEIVSLPESIGNLTKLKYLNVSNTEIASLPESIGNLIELDTLDISHTKIQELPDSIWNLRLETINMKGLPIE